MSESSGLFESSTLGGSISPTSAALGASADCDQLLAPSRRTEGQHFPNMRERTMACSVDFCSSVLGAPSSAAGVSSADSLCVMISGVGADCCSLARSDSLLLGLSCEAATLST